jgi:hypothetical protein
LMQLLSSRMMASIVWNSLVSYGGMRLEGRLRGSAARVCVYDAEARVFVRDVACCGWLPHTTTNVCGCV